MRGFGEGGGVRKDEQKEVKGEGLWTLIKTKPRHASRKERLSQPDESLKNILTYTSFKLKVKNRFKTLTFKVLQCILNKYAHFKYPYNFK